jgi:glycosyltransferase involved in cell wall biosynthesis
MWIQAPMVLNYLQTPTVYHVQEPPRWAYELSIPRPYLAGRWRKRLDRVDPLISLHWQAFTMLDRRNTLAATRLLANSCFTAANVQDVYGRHAEVAYLGVDSRVFHPLSDEKKEDFVLSVGELRPNKGFDFLIAAIARVAAADRPPLRIIGNASNQQEYAYLVSLAREKGVELDIEVMVDQETLVRRYNQAALLVYAPIHEPFGLVPLEAMACGTPVVAVAEGGVKETVLHHVTGLLTPREPGAFAAAVEQLLRDPERRNQMGNSGRQQTAAHWSWDTSVRHIESCLRDAAQTRRPSGDCE